MQTKLSQFFLLTLAVNLVVCDKQNVGNQAKSGEQTKQKDYFQRPGVKVGEIIEARGYVVEEMTLVSDDGYVLGLTRATNPLISASRRRALRREPILFIHGTLVDGNSFVMNSFDLDGPQDFTNVDAKNTSESELIKLFEDEPSAKSLAFFALNFGHEAWFLHRRGSPQSQKRVEVALEPVAPVEKLIESKRQFELRERKTNWRSRRSVENEEHGQESAQAANELSQSQKEVDVSQNEFVAEKTKGHSRVAEAVEAAPAALVDYGNLVPDIETSLNKRLWNHSFDEQAAYDLPRTVEFVLEKTGFRRLALVGDSSGGQLILQTLVLEPNLGNKLSKAICWVPSFNIGQVSNNQTFSLIQPLFDYIGPFPFTFLSHPLQALMEVACSMEVMQMTLCTLTADANWGNSAGKAILRPEFQSAYMTPVSAHEYLHLVQSMTYKRSRMFDFRDKKKNVLAYGQETPPHYNLTLINFEHISIYWGTSDTLVTRNDIETIHNELRVPHRIVTMDQPGVNHGGVLFHDHVDRIVIIPTYKDIISHGYKARDGNRRKKSKSNKFHSRQKPNKS